MNVRNLSIVICFRDWGLDRLSAAVRSHIVNSADLDTEVIVSDYGSRNPEEIRALIEPLGARVIRTETDASWSRSAALNAGVRESNGRVVITTDADIVFSPDCYRQVIESVTEKGDALYLVQCRDLPPGFDAETFVSQLDARATDPSWWAELEAVSTVRPRWGMGGLAGFSRETFFELNGYDERMRIWGGEDTDFALRFNRLGHPCRWLSSRKTQIYHIWHPPSQKKAYESPEQAAAVERNRSIVQRDASVVRNLPGSLRLEAEPPLVSVVVPTYKRGDLLGDCLKSCQRQTYTDFEVIVVENGDSNEAEGVVAGFEDRRFRYIKTEKQGAAAARNIGLDSVRGRYVVIHDDDDIMLSTRIEDHLRALRPGVLGSYGGWVDFDHETGRLLGFHSGKDFSYEAVLFGGKILTHGALMLDSRLFDCFRYDERIAAGIDYGFIARLARNGLQLAHTSHYAILRRMHGSNLTTISSREQKSAGKEMAEMLVAELSEQECFEGRAIARAAEPVACANTLAVLCELANTFGSSPGSMLERCGVCHESSPDEIRSELSEQVDIEVLRALSPILADARPS